IRRNHLEALALRQRAALADAHDLARFDLVTLVMRQILLRAHDEFLVDRVHEAALDADRDGLLVHVAHHHTLHAAPRHRRLPPYWAGAAAARRSPRMVMIRAMSLRT